MVHLLLSGRPYLRTLLLQARYPHPATDKGSGRQGPPAPTGTLEVPATAHAVAAQPALAAAAYSQPSVTLPEITPE